MSEYFRCILKVPRIPRSVQEWSGSSEINPELSIVQSEVSVEVRIKLEIWK